MSWTRRKPMEAMTPKDAGHQMARTLSWPHLLALGVGAIVGTGILTLIGVGADRAGPAVLLSFAISGAICACAALAYAELSTMLPAAGSVQVSLIPWTEEHTTLGRLQPGDRVHLEGDVIGKYVQALLAPYQAP